MLPGIIGSLQAMEAVKLVGKIGTPPLGKLTLYDALTSTFRSLNLPRNSDCALCGQSPTIHEPISYDSPCAMTDSSISVQDLAAGLKDGSITHLIDVRRAEEHAETNIPAAKLAPLSDIQHLCQNWDRSETYYIHCKSGVRSQKAIDIMLEQGFADLVNVTGGIDAWNDAGLG